MSAVMSHLDKSEKLSASFAQHAVIYDRNEERANEVATVLRFLEWEPSIVADGERMRSVMQANGNRQALLIGDVADATDWRELAGALKTEFTNAVVVVYGADAAADRIIQSLGAVRVLKMSFPFKYASLAAALSPAANVSAEEAAPVRVPTGRSPAIREVTTLIRQVAAHDSSVLILGESGTGKEVVARAIHDSSPRRQRPFVAINCGAIPADLLESELFGHEKGAFTGAVTTRKGRFEIAEGGTLFLDEIGDMSMPMQVKLLRVLQERVYERVGSQSPQRCNVRIIAATHRNLEESIAKESFREDLFYRLNVFPIEMPSLRSRIEDLPLLVRDFVRQNAAEGRGHIELSGPAFGALMHYAWPGNVRELGNLVERLSILYPDKLIGVAELPAKYRPPGWVPGSEREERMVLADDYRAEVTPTPAGEASEEDAMRLLLASTAAEEATALKLPDHGLDLKTHLFDIERELIRQALERTNGTVAHAARLLQLRRTTLVEKMRKLDMVTADNVSVAHDGDSEAPSED